MKRVLGGGWEGWENAGHQTQEPRNGRARSLQLREGTTDGAGRRGREGQRKPLCHTCRGVRLLVLLLLRQSLRSHYFITLPVFSSSSPFHRRGCGSSLAVYSSLSLDILQATPGYNKGSPFARLLVVGVRGGIGGLLL